MQKTVDIIKALRNAGLSQTEIARRSGVPQCRVSRWEKGAVARAADDALRLAELLAEQVAGGAVRNQEVSHA